MREGAYVNSIEALEHLQAAMCIFGDEVEQSLATIQSEIDAFVRWLEHDQVLFWRREIRVREEKVAEAKTDLHRCLSATIDPNHTPSCHQEKKALDIAKRRLEEAEAKLAAVRGWIPIVRRAVLEYRMKVEPMRGAAATDVPMATAFLASSVSRLLEYLSLAPPTGAPGPKVDANPAVGTASVAMPAEDRSVPPDAAAPAVPQADSEPGDTATGTPPSPGTG
jgi:hypothetical protein